ncbi:hypothetical protein I79_015919 [Cricetulus griseus]|uniref:Uncharacterized protein n=1 Tax=Cricetulus griseus TaxID=10029 RepID=G3HY20_CRIGR|nr:hypothetical protein I79_015919 [Cricetulus griseus]
MKPRKKGLGWKKEMLCALGPVLGWSYSSISIFEGGAQFLQSRSIRKLCLVSIEQLWLSCLAQCWGMASPGLPP